MRSSARVGTPAVSHGVFSSQWRRATCERLQRGHTRERRNVEEKFEFLFPSACGTMTSQHRLQAEGTQAVSGNIVSATLFNQPEIFTHDAASRPATRAVRLGSVAARGAGRAWVGPATRVQSLGRARVTRRPHPLHPQLVARPWLRGRPACAPPSAAPRAPQSSTTRSGTRNRI